MNRFSSLYTLAGMPTLVQKGGKMVGLYKFVASTQNEEDAIRFATNKKNIEIYGDMRVAYCKEPRSPTPGIPRWNVYRIKVKSTDQKGGNYGVFGRGYEGCPTKYGT